MYLSWNRSTSGLTFNSEFDVVFSNAALHWIKSPEAALKGFWKSLKPDGEFLAQFGGRGNAAQVFKIIDLMLDDEKWLPYFKDFVSPYGLYGPEEYSKWLENADFSINRLEMSLKDMTLEGEKGLFSWIESTWHPYTQQVPQELKEDFINELVTLFVNSNPPDDKGYLHVRMIRLEIEAYPEKRTYRIKGN